MKIVIIATFGLIFSYLAIGFILHVKKEDEKNLYHEAYVLGFEGFDGGYRNPYSIYEQPKLYDMWRKGYREAMRRNCLNNGIYAKYYEEGKKSKDYDISPYSWDSDIISRYKHMAYCLGRLDKQ